jgi:hypothetical protein
MLRFPVAAVRRATLGAALGVVTFGIVASTLAAQAGPSDRAVRLAPGTAAFAYAPGTQRYRVTTVDTRTQDQSAGRAPFEFTTTTTQYLTVALARRSPDTMSVTVTLDSTQVSSTLDAPQPDLNSFRGTRLQGTMSPQGRIYSFAPPAGVTDQKTVALYRAFKGFLAPVPAQMASGATWVDSTTDAFRKGEFDIKTASVTTSKVAGDTTYAGQQAWRVDRNGTVTMTGEGTERDKPIHLTVDGTIRGSRFMSASGVFLGATGTQTTRLELSMGEAVGGQDAPIQESIKSTVEALPAKRTAAR